MIRDFHSLTRAVLRPMRSACMGAVNAIALAACLAAAACTHAFADGQAAIVTLSVNIGASEAFYVDHQARYLPADGPHAVVLVHQSGADMASWRDLQQVLGERGIASLATAETHAGDVIAAIAFLTDKGYANIVPLGASAGGGGVLQALADAAWPGVSRAILLATASGPPLARDGVRSLHIVGVRDFYAAAAYSAYEQAVQPKSLLELQTGAHAQALLETEFSDKVITAIVSFVTGAE